MYEQTQNDDATEHAFRINALQDAYHVRLLDTDAANAECFGGGTQADWYNGREDPEVRPYTKEGNALMRAYLDKKNAYLYEVPGEDFDLHEGFRLASEAGASFVIVNSLS